VTVSRGGFPADAIIDLATPALLSVFTICRRSTISETRSGPDLAAWTKPHLKDCQKLTRSTRRTYLNEIGGQLPADNLVGFRTLRPQSRSHQPNGFRNASPISPAMAVVRASSRRQQLNHDRTPQRTLHRSVCSFSGTFAPRDERAPVLSGLMERVLLPMHSE